MATQNQIETNEALLGAGLMQHLKSFIQLFVSEQAGLIGVDLTALSDKVTAIIDVVDGDPNSPGYQAFQGLLTDVAGLKTDNTSNKGRLTLVETMLAEVDSAWKAEIARVETESKARDTALGLRIDGVQTDIANYAATRLEKDTEHDGRLATLEAFKTNFTTLFQQEVQRALDKEAALQADIDAAELRLDAVELAQQDFPTRSNVDSAFVKFCQGSVTELWAGRTQPAGLPTFSAV